MSKSQIIKILESHKWSITHAVVTHAA